MRVTVFGAGGPVAAAGIKALQREGHQLLLTDINAEALSPYRDTTATAVVDITNYQDVLNASGGADVLVNCTVVRDKFPLAFQVNCRGALNMMRAAQACGIRKVVQTGPIQYSCGHVTDYASDFHLTDDIPPRPGMGLYSLSKYLGQEVCRLYAAQTDIQVITLLFCSIYDPQKIPRRLAGSWLATTVVSWDDLGDSIARAVAAGPLPNRFEVFHIHADVPHGRVTVEKAKRLLGWQPKERFESLYVRDLSGQCPEADKCSD